MRRLRDQVRYVRQALDELRGEANVVSHYQSQVITGPRKKIEDVKYIISPTLAFINQTKKANKRHQEITQRAIELGVLTQEKFAQQYIRELEKEKNLGAATQGQLLKYPAITRGSR